MKLAIGPLTAFCGAVLLAITACSSPKKALAPTPTSSAAAGRIAATASTGGVTATVSAGATPAAALKPASGASVDGIPCETSEQLTYHVHSHLTILNTTQAVPVPALIGIVDNR